MLSAIRGLAGLVIVAFFVLAAILAPLIASHDPLRQSPPDRLAPPSWQEGGTPTHPLGTDQLGRDVWSRLVYGARTSLIVALGALAVGGMLGTTLGLLFRYYRGPWDNLYNLDVPFSLRLIVPVVWLAVCMYVALILAATFGLGISNVIVVMLLVTWPWHIGAARSAAMRLVPWNSIVQARKSGASDFRIITCVLFLKIASALPGLLLLQMGFLMAVEFILTFLGVGLQPPTATWGAMASDSRSIGGWGLAFPVAFITLLVAGFYMLGRWLLDRSLGTAV